MYASVFLIFYLKFRVTKSKIIIPLLQSVLISVAYFISISRVFDNRHWVVDITVGGLIGIFQAVHAWFIQCKNVKFNEDNYKDRAEGLPLNNI